MEVIAADQANFDFVINGPKNLAWSLKEQFIEVRFVAVFGQESVFKSIYSNDQSLFRLK